MDRALPSVCAQTYRNLEIIVAAHGCTDDTIARVDALKASDKAFDWETRVRVLNVPRRRTYPPTAENHWLAGPVVPANAALKACRGDWIVRCDDDDVLTNDHIEVLLKYAETTRSEFVSAAHETHEGRVAPYNFDGVLVGGIQTCMYRSYLKFFRYNGACWRKSWDRVNDVDLQARMVHAGVRMGYLDRIVARVLPRPGETTVGSKAYLDDREAKEKHFAFTDARSEASQAQVLRK